MDWLKSVMQIFMGWWIIVTGVALLPKIAEVHSYWFIFLYALATPLCAIYFFVLAVSKNEEAEK